MTRFNLILLFVLVSPAAVSQTDWNAPFPSHRMIGNIFYIGTEALASFLVATDDGLIVINSDFESTVPILRQNIENLGFDFSDVHIILGSHAHGDHMQGDILLKQMTGAQVMVMEQDLPLLDGMHGNGAKHPVDRVLHDGDTVTLGNTTLIAHLTPGHTPGCTSWEMAVQVDGETHNALIVCSFGVNPNYVLEGANATYPDMVTNYPYTFGKARSLDVDVFLGSHGTFFNLAEKYARLKDAKPGDPNPYIDRAGYLQHIDTQEGNFLRMLAQQRGSR